MRKRVGTMHIDWIPIVILVSLFIALIRETVKAERRASEREAENLLLKVKVESLERSYAASSRQLKKQAAKLERVQIAIHEMEQHPETVVINLCRLGVYMQQFLTTDEFFNLDDKAESCKK